MKRFLKNKKGFTLIELIVVMAIIAIIAAIGLPRFSAMREKAAISADGATAAQIANVCRIQETQTGTAVSSSGTGDAALKDENLKDAKPKSGGTFTFSKVNDKYVVTWTAVISGKNYDQKLTEGEVFKINDTTESVSGGG